MRKMYTTVQIEASPNQEQSMPNPIEHKSAISAAHVEAVKLFYARDDISRQAPGRRGHITVRAEDGTKMQYQTRHMTSSLLETHALFKEEFQNIKIGKSKFAELCPKHVFLSSKLSHNVCLCRYHENFITAVNVLHKALPSVPMYTHDLPKTFQIVVNVGLTNAKHAVIEKVSEMLSHLMNPVK